MDLAWLKFAEVLFISKSLQFCKIKDDKLLQVTQKWVQIWKLYIFFIYSIVELAQIQEAPGLSE